MDSSRDIIDHVAAAVEARLTGEGTGHDWQHIRRVRKVAERLGLEEGADIAVVALDSLLHDVDDRKLTGDLQTEIDLPMARKMMADAGAGIGIQTTVCDTIGMIGFHKGLKNARPGRLSLTSCPMPTSSMPSVPSASLAHSSTALRNSGRCSNPTAAR